MTSRGAESVLTLAGMYLLDTLHEGRSGTIGVYLVPTGGRSFALIETGPGSTLETVVDGIREAGFEPLDLDTVLVTHIHLDHAGAAGALATMTGARVVVHDVGAPHLLDPTRLLKSAGRIYGADMDRLWGAMTPVPEAQLQPVSGGEVLDLGEREIRVLYTPGHASHHVAYLLDGEALFSGDAAAIRLSDSTVVRPALPPPEVDLERWDRSLETIREAGASRLLLTHFGEVRQVEAHLERVASQNRRWADSLLEGIVAGEDDSALAARIRALSDADLDAEGGLAGGAGSLPRHQQRRDDGDGPGPLLAPAPDRPDRGGLSDSVSARQAGPTGGIRFRAGQQSRGPARGIPGHQPPGTGGAGHQQPGVGAGAGPGGGPRSRSPLPSLPNRVSFEAGAEIELRRHAIDLICLAGFMRILSPGFVEARRGRIVNVHPSLLPAFPGLRAQRQALDAGATRSGCSVHLVDAGVDTGPVILQRTVPVCPGDTEASLSARILEQEHIAYPEAVRKILRGELAAPRSVEP